MSGPNETLGDAPIEPQLHGLMAEVGNAIHDILNMNAPAGEKMGFVLLVFQAENHEGVCNYISNSPREDVVVLMKEQLARFEGRMGRDGTA